MGNISGASGHDLGRLADWKIPRKRHEISRIQSAFFALSVGAGTDTLNPAILPMVDPWNDRGVGHPALALILGYPGFWLGDPEVEAQTGLDAASILHLDQTVELPAPLPVEGLFLGDTRVTSLGERTNGRGVLLKSERIVTDAASGEVIAICRQTHLLRGVSLPGRPAPASERLAAPEGAPDIVTRFATRPDQALLYRLNGDTNRLHFDASTAAAAGFHQPILHGMCTVGFALTGLVASLAGYDPGSVAGFTVRMSAPVFPGDELAVDAWRNGGFRVRVPAREAVVLDQGQIFLR